MLSHPQDRLPGECENCRVGKIRFSNFQVTAVQWKPYKYKVLPVYPIANNANYLKVNTGNLLR
jgi:hypothetical protein